MSGMRCDRIRDTLTDIASRFDWDAFVFTFTMSMVWTDDKSYYVQEASPNMREFLKSYARMKLGHSLHRFSMARSDLAQAFEVDKIGCSDADRKLAALMRQREWHHGFALPHYGYGGALGLTVLLGRQAHSDAVQIKETFACLAQHQAQMNAWARQALERVDSAQELSPREVECLMLVGEGKTSREIAALLSLTKRTVEFHIQNAMHKLGGVSRSQAASRLAQISLPQFNSVHSARIAKRRRSTGTAGATARHRPAQ